MKIVPRLIIPEKGNRYYIAKSEGGLNPGAPRPKDSKLRFQNCVFYVLGRIAELWNIWLESTNAENFASMSQRYGFMISDKPALGAIACWAKGEVGKSGDGAGHVAIVEIVNASGSIVTSESGWSAKTEFWTKTRLNDGNWGQSKDYKFLGFLIPPGVLSVPTQPVRKGDKGDDVKWQGR